MHANVCMHILASTFQDGGNPFSVTKLPVLSSVTEIVTTLSATTLITQLMVTSGIYNTQKNHRLPCNTGGHMYACA